MISLRTALLATFVLVASYQHATARPSCSPVECCYDYVTGPIQVSKLVDFYTTPSECHLPAVVFKTQAERLVCADPSKPWVKRAVKILKGKRNQTTDSGNHR
uniref:C-C motif chemokine n=1 Tax=Pelusios castaneus TaxID=367368 RepID=A0A8C8SBR0_9SAUR